MVGGHKLLLWNFEKPDPSTGLKGFRLGGLLMGPYAVAFGLPDHPADVLAEWMKVETDTGEDFKAFVSRPTEDGQGQTRYFNSMPAGATHLHITILVQKMRTVEFLVKPPIPK
jgi:hypothetical protein